MVLSTLILGLVLLAGGLVMAWLARPRLARGGGVALAMAGGALAIASLVADHWTELTPRPVLAVMLERAEPYRKPAPGHTLAVDDALRHADDRWERLRWQQQYANAARAWYERVVAVRDAPAGERDARLLALVPHAERMQDLTGDLGGTLWADAWPARRMEARLRERAKADDAPGVNTTGLPLATWAITELQGLRSGTPEMRWGFIAPPMDVLSALAEAGLAAGDERAVLYAIDRAAPIKSRDAQAFLDHLATHPSVQASRGPEGHATNDEPIADRLDHALRWRADFAGPSTWLEAGTDAGTDAQAGG